MNSLFSKINKLKTIGILFILFGILFIYFNMNPSEFNYFPKCIFYISTGFYCPGCGSQRAAHHILHLDILKAFQQNLLFTLGLVFALYYLIIEILNSFFDKKIKNYLKHPKIITVLLFIVVAFGILRNISIYPFTLLMPK